MNEETLQLIQMSQNGSTEAKEQLVKENIGLIWSIVRRFSNRGYELEDLFQIGAIGLLKAIDKFEFQYDVQFSTYAVPMIIGEIKRFLRDDGMIKVSRSLKEVGNKARITREILGKKLNREPTIEEIAADMGVTSEEVIMSMESLCEIESLYKTVYQGDGNPIYLLDKINNQEDESSKVIDLIALRQMLGSLTSKEKEIIFMRYFQDKTQTEIAKKIGISQVQVSRLEKKILEQLKKRLS